MAIVGDRLAARDSKHPDGPVLTFAAPSFRAALRALGDTTLAVEGR